MECCGKEGAVRSSDIVSGVIRSSVVWNGVLR